MPALAYTESGPRDAIPALLLAGFPLPGSAWDPVVPGLSKAVRAVAPDLPGFGATPAAPRPATIDGFAADVLALADRVDAARFDLVGHSMGGYVALAVVRRAPERVRRLALVATRATADSDDAREARRRQIALVERSGAGELASILAPKLVAPSAPPILVDEVRSVASSAGVDGIVGALEAMMTRPDATEALASIRQPTLVVAGADDQVMPRAETDRLARAIAGARSVVLDRCGHLPMLEAPDRLAAELARHLSDRDAP